MPRTPFTDLEWNGTPVLECGHAELLQLAEHLHGMVWESCENFERVLAEGFPRHAVAGNA